MEVEMQANGTDEAAERLAETLAEKLTRSAGVSVRPDLAAFEQVVVAVDAMLDVLPRDGAMMALGIIAGTRMAIDGATEADVERFLEAVRGHYRGDAL